MPGTRTAGQPGTDAASHKRISLSFVDATGDQVTNSLIADAAVTDAVVETLAAETQLRSNASLYNIEITSVWSGIRAKSNALSAPMVTVEDNIRYSIKASPVARQWAYVPSVLISQLVAGTENPDVVALSDWFAAVLAVAGGAYTGLNVGYTQHKDQNASIKF